MSRTRPAADEALARRDAILSAVAFAAQRFLVADEWESVIGDVLGQLGRAADVSRAHVFQNVVLDGGIEASTHRFEWCAPGARPLIDDPETIDAPWGESQAAWRASLAAGDAVSRNVRDLPEPERSMFHGEGIVSLLDVPIFVGREWWGTIGFDETERERDWTEGETDALRAAAGTLGAARSSIERSSSRSRPRSTSPRSARSTWPGTSAPASTTSWGSTPTSSPG
jgi:GAF domain-containing protein